MNLTPPARRLVLPLLSLLCLLLAACDYQVPLSLRPDRAIDERFVGDWISPDGWMKVRRFDAENYVIYHNGAVYRAWHSTVAGLPLITLQSIETKETRFAYLTGTLSSGDDRLDLRLIRDEVVSKKINDIAAMRLAIEQHAKDPGLFTSAVPFSRMK